MGSSARLVQQSTSKPFPIRAGLITPSPCKRHLRAARRKEGGYPSQSHRSAGCRMAALLSWSGPRCIERGVHVDSNAFAEIVANELKIRRQPLGSTTWKRKKLKRAIESDWCYYFAAVQLEAYAAALRK